MSERLLIRSGRVVDPASRLDAVADVLLEGGRIAAVGRDLPAEGAEVIDAAGLVVCPGFVDLHTHLRDPGFEHKETIESGTRAAAAGGFTTLCCMSNTEPSIDSRAAVEYVQRTAAAVGAVRVLPIACVTRGRRGEALADFGDLASAGVVAFSDDGSPVADASLLRRALEYSRALGLPIVEHCEEPSLSAGAVMHEGWVSTRLGLRGAPAAAEESAVARAVSLVEHTGGHLHVAHVSTAGAVAIVRAAKARGLPVTTEVTPHHLTLTHAAVLHRPGTEAEPGVPVEGGPYDTNTKVNPPLRTREDVDACVEGLRDGTIDCVATDHAPHAFEDKACEFDAAAFGISGLETALGSLMTLVHSGRIDLPALIERLTVGPVRAFGLDGGALDRLGLRGIGTLAVGAPADVVAFDPAAAWTVAPERFLSKGRNTPLAGATLRGRVVATVYGGRVVYQAERVKAQ